MGVATSWTSSAGGRDLGRLCFCEVVAYIQLMQQWEYMTFDLAKPARDVEGLDRLGREGWEAVAMVSSWGIGWRFVHPIVLLKRLLPDDSA